MLAALALVLASALPAEELEVWFEVKLQVRERALGRRLEVDQWSGGRLRLRRGGAAAGALRYALVEIVESPWTLRWYPTRDEVKLGAAIWVPRPAGHPYGALAPQLEPLARERWAAWWDRDEAAEGPPWAAETGRFWADRHAREQADRDPLPPHPTFPFHVLGPLAGRFAFTLVDGVVGQVEERMTRPWLADGWRRALAGEAVTGYGYWERERPRWEPRTYETFAAALALLGPAGGDTLARVTDVLAAMQPAARGLRGARRERLRVREWISPAGDGREAQALVDEPGSDAFKVWVRVGFRAAPPRTP